MRRPGRKIKKELRKGIEKDQLKESKESIRNRGKEARIRKRRDKKGRGLEEPRRREERKRPKKSLREYSAKKKKENKTPLNSVI